MTDEEDNKEGKVKNRGKEEENTKNSSLFN